MHMDYIMGTGGGGGGVDNGYSVSVVSECLTSCTLHKLFLLRRNMVGTLFPCIESQ